MGNIITAFAYGFSHYRHILTFLYILDFKFLRRWIYKRWCLPEYIQILLCRSIMARSLFPRLKFEATKTNLRRMEGLEDDKRFSLYQKIKLLVNTTKCSMSNKFSTCHFISILQMHLLFFNQRKETTRRNLWSPFLFITLLNHCICIPDKKNFTKTQSIYIWDISIYAKSLENIFTES